MGHFITSGALIEAKGLAYAIMEASIGEGECNTPQEAKLYTFDALKRAMLGLDINMQTHSATVYLPSFDCSKMKAFNGTSGKQIYESLGAWIRKIDADCLKIVIRDDKNKVTGRLVADPDLLWQYEPVKGSPEASQIEQRASVEAFKGPEQGNPSRAAIRPF